MENLKSINPTKILIGKDVLDHLCTECLQIGNKVIIVIEKNSILNIGLYPRVVSLLNICGLEHITYQCHQKDINFSSADEAIDIAKKNGVNLVLAIGKESIIDFAKAIAIGFFVNHSISEFFKKKNKQPIQALPILNVITKTSINYENSPVSQLKANSNDSVENSLSSNYLFPRVSFQDLNYIN